MPAIEDVPTTGGTVTPPAAGAAPATPQGDVSMGPPVQQRMREDEDSTAAKRTRQQREKRPATTEASELDPRVSGGGDVQAGSSTDAPMGSFDYYDEDV